MLLRDQGGIANFVLHKPKKGGGSSKEWATLGRTGAGTKGRKIGLARTIYLCAVYTRYFWQGDHLIYGHIQCVCVFVCACVSNPKVATHFRKCFPLHPHADLFDPRPVLLRVCSKMEKGVAHACLPCLNWFYDAS